ncbi:helix-turn-helix transcriptional regulator [Lachnospiraceae bacterium 48-33]
MKQENKILIGEKIKKYRKEKGLTQKKLGELCGINEANIRKYELGKANPKIETIEKIANALETTADELRGIKKDIAYNVDEIVEALNRYKAQQLENETLSYNGRWIACKVIEECIKIVKTGGDIHRR